MVFQIFVVLILGISVSKNCFAVISFLRVGQGTSISFIDLWDLTGYSVGTKSDNIFRNGVIDSNFTTGCPEKIYFKFFRFSNNTEYFSLRYHQPFFNNSLAAWLTSNPQSCNKPDLDISTITLQITPNEDVILKAYKNNQVEHLYFAVYNPKHLGPGYPKYYVFPDGQGYPSNGTIPGNESLFVEYDHLKITSVYNTECNITDTSQTKSPEEIKNIINGYTTTLESTTSMTSSDTTIPAASNSVKQGSIYCYYKKSDIGEPTTVIASVLWTVTAESSIKCGARCNIYMESCKSFFYIPDTGVCMGLSHMENSDNKPAQADHYHRI